MKYDYIVIGAGVAGMSFAALMENLGFKVALLERHSLPGGCASYFERDGYIFDAGATTLSGLKENRPLSNLIKELDLEIECLTINPGLVSVLSNKEIYRFSNNQEWLSELILKFPDINHAKLWKKISEIELKGWELSSDFKNIPIHSFKEINSFLTLKTFKALGVLPALFKSVAEEIKDHKIVNPEYLKMLNELLFITAQNNAEDTPLLMGAMGLCYPEDTSYAMGGMKAFSEALAKKCSNVFFRNKVKRITPLKEGIEGYQVITDKSSFTGAKLISTIPIWNHQALFDDRVAKDFFAGYSAPNPDECWSAFMIYLTIPLNSNRKTLYYQIHTDPIPYCETKSFFVSLSHPEDKLRSINGRQVVTISTHTKSLGWSGLDREEYLKRKEIISSFILNILREKFQLKESDLQNILTGSPSTFEKYTGRHQGLVGGIPHSLKRNPLSYLIARSPYPNFYMLGDTQYPGQGIASVVLGAQNLSEYLK